MTLMEARNLIDGLCQLKAYNPLLTIEEGAALLRTLAKELRAKEEAKAAKAAKKR